MSGLVSPLIKRLTRGLPSVDATAIPPWLAVVSLEILLLKASVTNPRTMSGSETTNCCVLSCADVPPIVILPFTFKFPRISVSLSTVRS